MTAHRQQQQSRRRFTAAFVALMLLWVATLATAHALTHAISEPEPVCSVCLAADHSSHGLQFAATQSSPTTRPIQVAATTAATVEPVSHPPYASRAPPSSSAVS